MVHTFQALGVNVAVDVNSGAVHVLDELTYRLLEQVTPPMAEHCPEEIKSVLAQFDPNALEEAWQELRPPCSSRPWCRPSASTCPTTVTCAANTALPPPETLAQATG